MGMIEFDMASARRYERIEKDGRSYTLTETKVLRDSQVQMIKLRIFGNNSGGGSSNLMRHQLELTWHQIIEKAKALDEPCRSTANECLKFISGLRGKLCRIMRDQEPMTILLAGKTGGLSESIATMIVRLGIEETNEMCSRGTFVEIANSSRRLPEYIDSYIENQCDPTVLWIEGVKKSPDAAADLLDRIIQCRIADGKITVLTSDLHNTELMEMLHEVGDALTGTKVVSFDFDGASTSFDLVKLRDKIDRMIMAGVATATHEEILAICKGLK